MHEAHPAPHGDGILVLLVGAQPLDPSFIRVHDGLTTSVADPAGWLLRPVPLRRRHMSSPCPREGQVSARRLSRRAASNVSNRVTRIEGHAAQAILVARSA